MPTRYFRLDRFLSQQLQTSRSDLRPVLAAGRVSVNGEVVRDRQLRIGPFDRVECDGRLLAQQTRHYWMLNKPAGVVSATRDEQHMTVMDLLPEDQRQGLHLAGRLDFNSTGLMLLTNDGAWSRRLSLPETGLWKHYRVRVDKALSEADVAAFARGMWFDFEKIHTQPARLVIRSAFEADVWLHEGKYHQIKRMFGRNGKTVTALHRLAVGGIQLDATLAPGESRALTKAEQHGVFDAVPEA